jgi:serine/threonine protein kinase
MNQVHALASGTRIESYEIQRVLGVGGFGITYQAYDPILKQTVAIKEYLPSDIAYRDNNSDTVRQQGKEDQEFYQYGLQRFLDEARTLAKFRHDHIVRISHYIEANATAYLIMDFEAGESLSQYLKQHKTLSERHILQLLMPLLQGLQTVHAKNILHRDVKPSNILLRTNNAPVLIDFGSARPSMNECDTVLTAVVTPGYAPFEQYNGDNQGDWTDLYGLGATIYHCMTGEAPPFATLRIAANYQKNVDPINARFEALHSDYSVDLITLIQWMIRSNPKSRPQSVADVLEYIQEKQLYSDDKTLIYKTNTTSIHPPYNNNITAKTVASNHTQPQVAKSIYTCANDKTHSEPQPSLYTQSQASNNLQYTQTVEQLSINLSRAIGPIAKILIKKAQTQTSDPNVLVQQLAKHISSQEQRDQFIKVSGFKVPTIPLPKNMMTTASQNGRGQTTTDTEINSHTIERTIRVLSTYMGPIAKILVHRTVKKVASPKELFQQLSKELANQQQRKEFINKMTL